MTAHRELWQLVAATAATAALGCGGDDMPAAVADLDFHWVARTSAALMSVQGTSADDVWLAGADDGTGPLLLHWDGGSWERRETGVSGDLWWVHPLPGGPVFLGGSGGLALRYEAGAFEVLPTPATGEETVFGVWAASPENVYFVGSVAGKNGFIWRFDGERFETIALPAGLPEDSEGNTPALLKIWGRSPDEVWAVGAEGVVLRGNAENGFELVQAGGSAILFTVHANAGKLAIVGGSSSGVILEAEGDALVDVTPPSALLLQGVSVADSGAVWAAGYAGTLYEDSGNGFVSVDSGLDFRAAESLHSIWVDPDGGVWAAGGDVLTPELDQGLALHRGAQVPEF